MNVVFFNMYIYYQHLIDFYMPAHSSLGAKWFRSSEALGLEIYL